MTQVTLAAERAHPVLCPLALPVHCHQPFSLLVLELSITSMVWEVGSRPRCAQLMLWALLAFMKFVIAPCLLNARKPQNIVFPQTLFAVPTFEVLSLAPQHFFRKTPRDRKHNWKLPWFKGFLYIVFICSSCFISLLLCKVIYCSQAGRHRN